MDHPSRRRVARSLTFTPVALALTASAIAQVPPPAPSANSSVGQSVTNPVIAPPGDPVTTVSALETSDLSFQTVTQYVLTADGWAFLVQPVGVVIYHSYEVFFRILAISPIDPAQPHTSPIATIQNGTGEFGSVALWQTYDEYVAGFYGGTSPGGTPEAPVTVEGANGVKVVRFGAAGDGGGWGTLFFPAGDGDPGGTGGSVTGALGTNATNILATTRIGFEAGSRGGNGGDGGDSYVNVFPPGDGGNGGRGGTVSVINNAQIATQNTAANNLHGIFAYSQSGDGGSAGSGYLAPSGGSAGSSPNGGNVTVTNNGLVQTDSIGSTGIFALSVSGNGGGGGSSWGLVGSAGIGGLAGNGGEVFVNNREGSWVITKRSYSNAIGASSIGGTGGSAGTSGNLLFNLPSEGQAGGNGGAVTVSNAGFLLTEGHYSRGIAGVSAGGGGGDQGGSYGLVTLGGQSGAGGNGGAVSVINLRGAIVETRGIGSDAIFATSIGGSGGSTSDAYGLVALGGDGAVAGHGGAVLVENYGEILTLRDHSSGIVAESIGGGGGDGGSTGGMVSVGGRGGAGGHGGSVRISSAGSVTTEGDDAGGIFAQSVGGGGGNGSSSGSVSVFAGYSLGGNGGEGGHGGNVEVVLGEGGAGTASTISTKGDFSKGLMAQSVGGGGGIGGGSFQVTAGYLGAGSINTGGSGGAAAGGGLVTLSTDIGRANIETAGDHSQGVFIQSVGGTGGDGGTSIAVAVAGGDAFAGSLAISQGGQGGLGGHGGTVRSGAFDALGNLVTTGFNGNIVTDGLYSTGFLSQSVGGGGGNAGLTISAAGSGSAGISGSVSVGLGASGGNAGHGGLVEVGMDGNITTLQGQSIALLAQSVGGGGGNGGATISGGASGGFGFGGAGQFSMGGSGGGGGNGNIVRLATRSSLIQTSGDDSIGIVVQSTGGGGGTGGYNISAGGGGGFVGAGAVSVGIGGTGGTGGAGGAVIADLQSDIITLGNSAAGIIAQSTGGGGGIGGYNISVAGAGAVGAAASVAVGLGGSGGSGGNGASVNLTSTGSIATGGAKANGLTAQSIGGGGGTGGYNISVGAAGAGTGSGALVVGLGGSGGTASHGGLVTLHSSGGLISTLGMYSIGVLAQSVGGGGGDGGYDIVVAGTGAGVGSAGIAVGLGGTGGGGGNGGAVELTVSNDVETTGDYAAGVFAQSIGKGGGVGGYNISVAGAGAGGVGGGVAVGLGGSGGGGGHSGAVTATSTGSIHTRGDKSNAFTAQSLGGGGGSGGYNISVAASLSGTASGSVSVGLGGSGGVASDGGTVLATVSGNVWTEGTNSIGILAQSAGGAGGDGAFNVSAAGAFSSTGGAGASVGIGGTAGGGGNGAAVTLHAGSALAPNIVLIEGRGSMGIVAQSLGGSGGVGGMNVSAAISGSGAGAGAVGVGLGGSGGAGGNGSIVNSTVYSTIINVPVLVALSGSDAGSGDEDPIDYKTAPGGLLAQSVGGGGGVGGINITGVGTFASTGAGAVAVGIGGMGGDGGHGSTVTNNFTGTVETFYDGGFGIAAQSLGGSGGVGGINYTGALSASSSGSGAIAFGMGGFGGGGGNAGAVDNTVNTLDGFVVTQGNDAIGVISQSLGGGGGMGAMNVTGLITAASSSSGGVGVGIGGFGGGGGDSGVVISHVTGGVVTMGDKKSKAILTQSVGGAGGDGAMNVTGTLDLSNTGGGGTLGFGLGGFGGAGGNGGRVESYVATTNAAQYFMTTGESSTAITAQSIGGAGGVGGMSVTGAVSLTGGASVAVGVGLGGFGGGGGDSDVVILDVTGDVTTFGNYSDGLFAQSLGGAGGVGGINITGSLAIAGQTVGTATAISLGVGGFGGAGGNAGSVTVNYSGTIAAASLLSEVGSVGAGAHGLVAQSLGGGGGVGGMNVSGGISVTSNTGTGTGAAYGAVFGLGGFGGAGGDASTVDVTVTGGESITTYGLGRSAIFAQSLGGAGGDGGMNVTGGLTSNSSLLFGFGGFAGDAGVGHDVVVNAVTDVNTFQRQAEPVEPEDAESVYTAAGVFAQSVGGGGGNGGTSITGGISFGADATTLTFGLGGFGGAGAASGDVDVTLVGDATTTGLWVHGILAQSVGGGGGNGGLNVSGQVARGGGKDIAIVAGVGGYGGTGADAGDVVVNHTGAVTTLGDNARGVLAQSIGGGGGMGGMNVTGLLSYGASPITVGIGGSGEAGGNAGAVTVNRGSMGVQTGALTTTGSGANGIEASSIGGGGGDAGMNFVAGVALGVTGTAYAFQAAVGGAGGVSGVASTATVNNFSDITTNGASSHGILAQSIGAGGGNGNYNMGVTGSNVPDSNNAYTGSLTIGGQPGSGGEATDVSVTQVGNIETFGGDSFGIAAQSIGGGGGNIGYDLGIVVNMGAKNAVGASVQLGKIGGTGGSAGSVELHAAGTIHTRGAGSYGLMAQSIGAGGGTSSTTTVGVSSSTTEDAKQTTTSASVSVGRTGGEGGGASSVTVNAIGGVTTEGDRAHAILAQSVGGGGGTAGSASTLGMGTNAPSVGVAVGGEGGEGGVGGSVEVMSAAAIVTGGDNALGILAQSVGGGGGVGGDAWTGGVGYGAMTVNVALGGSGGGGNTSDTVTVDHSGSIATDGEFSHGILAQSIGGGGGNGGMTLNVVTPATPFGTVEDGASVVSVLVGAAGGTGAVSRAVAVTNTGSVFTDQTNSIGILAQSIGGGGGNAGNICSGQIMKTSTSSIFSFSIGGTGGTGGSGDAVSVENLTSQSVISTAGDGAHGIYAMSLGGGGGIGTSIYAVDLNLGPSNGSAANVGMTLGVGGSGAVGGSASTVDVRNEGRIQTSGANAHGIIAQSVGGGGGAGGGSFVGNLVLGGTTFGIGAPTMTISIGGFGGDGNTSADVAVTNTGTIEVAGAGSYGVYAQSVGGGGGNGAWAVAASPNALDLTAFGQLTTMAMGGFGGSGADSGDVTVTNNGSIVVRGDDAYGIYAQSVGGGGGNTGWSVSSPAWIAASAILDLTLGGGSSGTAGDVTVTGASNITMYGKNSQAVFAQSVNGGGGNAEIFIDVSEQAVRIGEGGIIIPTEPAIASTTLLMELGMNLINHNDWLGLDSGTVSSSLSGDVAVQGSDSTGSETQSISGGGGTVSNEIVVDTLAETEMVLEIGGLNVENGDGGDITAVRDGDVLTQGDDSIGVEVQSIGGGGGSANIGVTTVLLPGHTGGFANATVVIGGDTTIGSDGGLIDANYTGDVSTRGARSPGLLLQSIGAGGGKATLTGLDSLDATVGGQNAASGNGAPITVTNEGSIATAGEFSHGIVLQSIGGGGGALWSDATELVTTASADNTGDGGAITFSQVGDVTVQGDGAIGILAQSLGGGGGLVNREFMDTAGGVGSSGPVTLTVDGDIAATGEDGIGIVAQSRGSTGQGNIAVTLSSTGQIVVGDSGVGVFLSGGNDNTFVNEGIVYADSTAASPDGFSVMGSEWNDAVTNNGTFYGSVDLGAGNNTLVNAEGANLYAGATLFVGAAADRIFENHGRLALGGSSTYTTELTGSFVQGPSGQMDVTVDCSDDSIDFLHVSGTATMEGVVNVLLADSAYLKPGERELIFLLAEEGVDAESLTLLTPETGIARFSLGAAPALDAVPEGMLMAVAAPNFIPIQVVVDFDGFKTGNQNQTQLGQNINRIQHAGGSPELAGLIAGLVALPTDTALFSAYNTMSPEVYTSAQRSLQLSSDQFVESMLGCNRIDGAYKFALGGDSTGVDWVAFNRTSYLTGDDGTAAAAGEDANESIQKGHFFWVNTTVGFYDSHQTSEYLGFNSNSVDVAAGVQFDLGDDLYFGAAVGYASVTTNYNSGVSANSNGTMGELGVSLTKFYGATKVAFALAGGYGDFDVTRSNIFSSPTAAEGEFGSTYYAARVRVAHEIDFTSWYARPFIDAAFTGINTAAFNETGAGAMDLIVSSSTYNAFSVNPTLQVGTDFKSGEWTLSPQASVGYSWYSAGAPSMTASLEGSPGGVSPFEVYGLNDQNYVNASAGIDFKLSNKALIQLYYSGQFSQNTQSNNVQVKLSIPF